VAANLIRRRDQRLDHRDRRDVLDGRLRTLLSGIGGTPPVASTTASATDGLINAVTATLPRPDPAQIWLTLAVLTARLPTHDQVMSAVRAARLDGLGKTIHELIGAQLAGPAGGAALRTVEIVSDTVVVDLNHTARTALATGIQRVARETTRRWVSEHDPVLIGWTGDYTALRRLSPAEQRIALHGADQAERSEDNSPRTIAFRRPDGDQQVIVPLRCTYLLPELAAELPRSDRMRAVGEFADTTVGMIGFDCVPLTSAETAGAGMPGLFSRMLGAAALADRIATISEGAAVEYRGWRQMLSGADLAGPDIQAIGLATEATGCPPEAIDEATELLTVAGLPMVLIVGSHEPRKNHLAVLHAAELLWREKLRFSLVFVGGNAWRSDRFDSRIRQLQRDNRPVQLVSALSDDLLAAAYRVARFTVFPSLNEGFGLPVAESLSCGTPVVTSNFGSMREIAEPGGALLVDPRDDHEIAAAMRTLLTDSTVHAQLTAQALTRPPHSWDDYAAMTWAYLVDGRRPEPPPDPQ
jgi:glycosyltransferase involved in cell wall biosynthesis